ncbi:MAG: hypothetical protein NVS9B1_25350 [Candidatus Dormibacteraceae bacterium]
MPNLQDSTFPSGRIRTEFQGSIARTDTTAKNLFVLPAGAIPFDITVSSAAVSNAATTATISVGKSGGTGVEFLTTQDVKGASGSGVLHPAGPATSLFGVSVGASSVTVTGVYAETGAASNAGGPWLVVIGCYVV